MSDIDNDSDQDVLYFANDTLYYKQNLEKKDIKNFISDLPIIVNSNDNKFYNGDNFIESINNPQELILEN
jgi:hypothetical protein